MSSLQREQGAAILTAMVVVTMVATLAATAVSWQTKNVEIQVAERARAQAMWLLRGAMDWSRLLLRQDAQSAGSVDHLAEPWSVPLQETKLTTFISADGGVHQVDASADMSEAFLAGAMHDMQAKINIPQWLSAQSSDTEVLQRLFALLQLPQTEYESLVDAVRKTQADVPFAQRLIAPRSLEDLVWLGVSASTVQALEPYAYWSTHHAKINLNTAGAVVLQAAANLTLIQAQALVTARKQQHYRTLAEAQKIIDGVTLSAEVFAVNSQQFMAQGWVRMDGIALSLQAQLQRNGVQVFTQRVGMLGMPLPQPNR